MCVSSNGERKDEGKEEKREKVEGKRAARRKDAWSYVCACVYSLQTRARAPSLLAFHAASKSRGGENDDLEW